MLAQDPLCLGLSCPQALDNDMIYSVLNYVLYIDKLIYAFQPSFVEGIIIFTIHILKMRKLRFREERRRAPN